MAQEGCSSADRLVRRFAESGVVTQNADRSARRGDPEMKTPSMDKRTLRSERHRKSDNATGDLSMKFVRENPVIAGVLMTGGLITFGKHRSEERRVGKECR